MVSLLYSLLKTDSVQRSSVMSPTSGRGGRITRGERAERRRWREERRRVSEQTRAPRRATSERDDDVCEGAAAA